MQIIRICSVIYYEDGSEKLETPVQKLNTEKSKFFLLFISQLCYCIPCTKQFKFIHGYFCNHVKYLICLPDTFCETQREQKEYGMIIALIFQVSKRELREVIGSIELRKVEKKEIILMV